LNTDPLDALNITVSPEIDQPETEWTFAEVDVNEECTCDEDPAVTRCYACHLFAFVASMIHMTVTDNEVRFEAEFCPACVEGIEARSLFSEDKEPEPSPVLPSLFDWTPTNSWWITPDNQSISFSNTVTANNTVN